MHRDFTRWTQACLTCATYQVGKKVGPPLTQVPVAGAFDRVGVDILQFPKTRRGNRYAVVFVDYPMKWPKVPDQTSATIARLLIEEVVSRHRVPSEVLSNGGKSWRWDYCLDTSILPHTIHRPMVWLSGITAP